MLKDFVTYLQVKPEIIHLPELSFFKKYMESMYARIPLKPDDDNMDSTPPPPGVDDEEEDITDPPPTLESEESDVELDTEGVIEPDNDTPHEAVDEDKEVSEEDLDKANDIRGEAMSAMSDGDLETAITKFTEAIQLNPGSAILYAKRANCYIKLKKPNMAIRDCTSAIKHNPDSAAGYKFRGRAHGCWDTGRKPLKI